ncbi:SLAIN motif-containing protein 1a isoform X2 [Hypomesus transpacificus]|uniref:SLAIN motif-containing protein 1a isoform X2 n=1 Tax=Hypomesus transpacificus TaxID=137520 RepID=UPI001F083930|nr:SLAIN motif-containing protein 1a isoform X2 [Hypomesus transpacificus]
MEAEVLNPQMMADVNGNNKIADAELEVKKLQELVRKLERQNEQLRTRANVNNCTNDAHHQNSLPPCLHGGNTVCLGCSTNFLENYGGSSPTTPSYSSAFGPHKATEEPFEYFHPSSVSDSADVDIDDCPAGPTVLDEVDVLDLNTVLPILESESWLHVSPKARLLGQTVLSPLQWCRLVLDHPGPEVEQAKKNLFHRLDQASFSPSSHTFLQQTLPGIGNCSQADRTPTFLSHSSLQSVAFGNRRHAAVSPQSSLDSELGVPDLEDDSISMGYKLQDMTDVQVMARLQEESLRQEYASTSATISRRSSSFSLHSLRRSEMDLEEEEEDEEEGYDQLPPPQPQLFRSGSMQRGSLPHSHTFSSIRESVRRSPSTHQYSLSGLSQHHLSSGPSSLTTDTHMGYRHTSDKLRRSMPNLIRAPSMPCVPSVPTLASPVNNYQGPTSLPMNSLRNSQSFDSSNGLARLQSSIPSPGQLSQRVQSVGSFPSSTPRHPLKATAYVSPTVQQGPPAHHPSTLSSSTSLHSFPSSVALPQPLKSSPSIPQALKAIAPQTVASRSGLPRPTSFIGTNGTPRPSKIAQPTRSLLTPPKSLAALSALRDGSWKDGCY